MKTLFKLVCISFMICNVQAIPLALLETNAASPATLSTNGLIAWARRPLQQNGYTLVFINVRLVPNTNYPYFIKANNTNLLEDKKWEEMKEKRWPYFAATNSFCGPIALHDAAGKSIPLLKPEVNRLDAYPKKFSLSSVSLILSRNVGRRSIDLPIELWHFSPEQGHVQLQYFKLENYFKPEKPGEYQLTVWPKIYKRSATNDDICERVDLSPVIIPVKLK